ncbi:MAG: DUF4129 domain-containing protein, partial [Candidatus Thiodiazotropha sp.]
QIGRNELSMVKLGVMILAAMLLLGMGVLLSLNFSGFTPKDPLRQALTTLQKKLGQTLPLLPGECPSHYVERLRTHAPEMAQLVAPLIERYLTLRYGSDSNAQDNRAFIVDVKRFVAMI